MAEQQTTHEESDPLRGSGDAEMSPDVVAESLGGAYWWVDDCGWASVQPSLPDDLIALLAPPILVGAAPVPPAVPAEL